jgi:ADP-ribosyl-[dinitrogen reductase] hydrolase
MPSNRQILDDLFRSKQIDLCQGSIFNQPPRSLSTRFEFDKIEGMMLGLAIGDALGVTTEGWLAHERREAYGTIRDYIPNRYGDAPIGLRAVSGGILGRIRDSSRVAGRLGPI